MNVSTMKKAATNPVSAGSDVGRDDMTHLSKRVSRCGLDLSLRSKAARGIVPHIPLHVAELHRFACDHELIAVDERRALGDRAVHTHLAPRAVIVEAPAVAV